MGMYVNPGNGGFRRMLADEYVDKTGLIALVNAVVGTPRGLVCSTRPRRFGKTFAAESLVAYYTCGADSRTLFEGLDISRDPGFEEHLNAYNVVHLDMTAFRGAGDVAAVVRDALLPELRALCHSAGEGSPDPSLELVSALADVVAATGRRFVFVIDEWDAPLRERRSKASQEDWVYFLRLLFKNATFTPDAVAACYMTGILPIVRYGTQSALSDFDEYTVLAPDDYAPYVGLTEAEVETLAARHHMDMAELRRWYDGYELPYVDKGSNERRIVRAYAPYSVMRACKRRRVGPYWTSSEAFASLRTYVDLDFDGLQQSIVQALGGAGVRVDTHSFENSIHDVANADDALTLLCHLGYLCYDAATGTARVPNEEVRAELRQAVAQSRHPEVARIVRESDALLRATWDLDEDAVAAGVARAHDDGCAPVFYNDEQALRAVVKSAYIAAADHYATIEELPSGRGLADVVYLPRRGDPSPALLVELKWDRAPEAAIAQARNRDYPAVLRGWGGPILLVGVTYDRKSKRHVCRIEEA
ncbi:MAG: AAA family ATPase [Coriobacteriales bacterium]|nr:AAA family ATPase [Coriobacteriales bacterium]